MIQYDYVFPVFGRYLLTLFTIISGGGHPDEHGYTRLADIEKYRET